MKIIADTNIPFVKECCQSVGEVTILSGRDITPQAVAGADALLVRSITRVDEKLLAGSPVRFVGTATIGFDHVDVDYLHRSGIGFASAPGSNANSAAEYVLAALLEIGKRKGITLAGKSIGVIGVGNVGSRIAAKCEAIGMRVLRNDPPLARLVRRSSVETQDLASPQTHATYVPIEELYDCDFITIHTPLTHDGPDRTYHLADEKFFKSLKKGAVFVNASRGDVVDSRALKSAMEAGRLRAVALDVWEGEPDIDVDLLQKVDLASPHIAGYSFDGKVAGMVMIYRSLCEHFGLEARHDVADFLPQPEVPRLVVHIGGRDDQAVLAEAIEKIYPITRDDRDMRGILKEPPQARGKYFDALRKNYPVRRESHNTTVVIDNAPKSLVEELKGIGFKVEACGTR
jgi:erythronate-4-phosphate dehydrogenase